MTRLPVSNTYFLLFVFIMIVCFSVGCDRDEGQSQNSSRPLVHPSQLAGTAWQQVATANVYPNAPTLCSLKTAPTVWSISGSSSRFSSRYGVSVYPDDGSIRWSGASNLYTIIFGNSTPGAPFQRGDSARMEVYLDGQAMRTVWTQLRFPYTVQANLWVQINSSSNTCLAGIVRTGKGEALTDIPLFKEEGSGLDSVGVTDQYGFFALNGLTTGYHWITAIRNNEHRSAGGNTPTNNSTTGVDIAFEAGSLTGRVIPANSQYGSSPATIRIEPHSRITTAESNRKYRFYG
ncbi:MAG: hypothetical protein OEM52_05620, partial [bacterium]|nr:hypothetical protein [bacterium]